MYIGVFITLGYIYIVLYQVCSMMLTESVKKFQWGKN